METVSALLDTGAEVSVVHQDLAFKHDWKIFKTDVIVTGPCEDPLQIIGETYVMIVPKGDNLATCTTLLILKKLEYTLVLGFDFQMNHKVDIQVTKNEYFIKQPLIKGSINSGNYKLRPVTDQELQLITARKTSNGSKASIHEINV